MWNWIKEHPRTLASGIGGLIFCGGALVKFSSTTGWMIIGGIIILGAIMSLFEDF
jgi:hypothetical protein